MMPNKHYFDLFSVQKYPAINLYQHTGSWADEYITDLGSKLTSHVSIYIHLDMADKKNSIYFLRIGSLRLQHHRLDALANLKKSFLHKLIMLDNKR